MSNGSQLSLEILIKTIADSRGIQVSREEIARLAETTRQAAAAGKDYTISAEKIVDGLQQQKAAATEAAKAQDTVAEATGGASDELKRAAQEWVFYNGKTTEAAKTTKRATDDLKGMQQAAQGANQIMNGLSQGGMTGLIVAGRGVIATFRAIASTALGGTLIGALAAAGVAIEVLKKKTRDNLAEMDKAWQEAAKSSESYNGMLAKVDADGAKRLEAHLKAVQAVSAAYADLQKAMDAAASREDTLSKARSELEKAQIDRDETAALAKATTPEQRDKIKAEYATKREGMKSREARTALDREELQSKVRERNAQDVQSEASATIRGADVEVLRAQQSYEQALDVTRQFSPDDNSAPAQAARDRAFAAQAAVKKAEANRAAVAKELTPTIEQSQSEIDAARLSRERVGIERQTLSTREEQRGVDLRQQEKRVRAEINKTAAEKGSAAVTDAQRSELAQLTAAIRENTAAQRAAAEAPKQSQQAMVASAAAPAPSAVQIAADEPRRSTITRGGQTIEVTDANTVSKLADGAKGISKVTQAMEAVASAADSAGKKAVDVERKAKESRERTTRGS